MKYNNNATCENCGSYTKKGSCKKAMNLKIDYTKDNNPHCWDWTRSIKSNLEIIFKLLKKSGNNL